MRKVELLAPAKNLEIGIEAFNHGADAVYIGAPLFSARAAAGNSVRDIEQLARYGHQFDAKTIVALNTILKDSELRDAERLIWQLYEAGSDALIIQDLGILELNLPPIELHASTQTDNRTIEKTRLMHDLGMTRVVMARELSIEQIRKIHEAVPDVELECFVHGALCVCISGQCYLSAALTGRSANRGECAQPCRLPMDLYEASRIAMDGAVFYQEGKLLAKQKHLLSLRDMNRSAYLEQLIDAGVSSLKIEGRLKDVTYVKNVVAYYRQLLDQLYEKQMSDGAEVSWKPASLGHCTYTFEPKVEKSFNRGFTHYFADGQRQPIWNFESPKAIGEKVGQINRVYRDSFTIRLDNDVDLHNGDGLSVGSVGFRMNRFDPSRNECFPLEGAKVCPMLKPDQFVWRNQDDTFEKVLSKVSSRRTLPVDISFFTSDKVITMTMCLSDMSDVSAEVTMSGRFELALKSQKENVIRQLCKLGDTVFTANHISLQGEDMFVPSSLLTEIRRKTVAQLLQIWDKVQTTLRTGFVAPLYSELATKVNAKGVLPTDFLANVFNQNASRIYGLMGLENVDDAFEKQKDKSGKVMQTKHCLKYAFGQCPKYTNPCPEKLLDDRFKLGNETLLKIGNKNFLLKFGCKNDCISEIFTIFAPK